MCPGMPADPLPAIRWAVLALVGIGLAGTGTELLFIGHYEDRWQVLPLVLIAIGLVVIAGHVVVRRRFTIWLLRLVMVLFVAAGAAGVVLHYRGNREFQLEMDATLAGWPLMKKILSAEAPPALAPGVLAQFGLLGLVYTYRHPILSTGKPHQEESRS